MKLVLPRVAMQIVARSPGRGDPVRQRLSLLGSPYRGGKTMTDACLPQRVLLIDDDPHVRTTLAFLLRQAGHAVEEAESGSAGIARFRENQADIVLTDFTMPGLTGWDVARTVKSINPRVPVVYVTGAAHAIAPHQRAAVEAIIEKPCGSTTLHTVIRQLTATHGEIPPAGRV